MFDLARYFAWGLDPKTRKQFKDKVIEAYYSKLTELQSGRGDVPKYTLDIVSLHYFFLLLKFFF